VTEPSNPDEPDDPETALRLARARLIATFEDVCAAVERAPAAGLEALRSSRQQLHRLAGLAGIVGFPRVSEEALDFEAALTDTTTLDAAHTAVERLRRAFADDLAAPPPRWA
jgi:HPt (histidine-containing phosphotransfer) domain-containing protein